MKVAFCGMGKLGFPCALAAALRHDVVGYDIVPGAKKILDSGKYPHREVGADKLLYQVGARLHIVDTVDEAVEYAEIVFVAVQTPHGAEYEGITRMPETRADFSYEALKTSVASIAEAAARQKKRIIVVVISTVLPGTSEREIYPLLNEYVDYVYNPFFIAMGTTIVDYLKPEFVLLGCDSERRDALAKVEAFYNELHEHHARLSIAYSGAEVCRVVPTDGVVVKHVVMSVASAELTKVSYNVFLGLKISAANAVMEIAHKTGANCDDVTRALALATDRVVSSKYMKGGGGDSGPCHARDQIALSWLAQKLDLSYDLFGSMVRSREAQTEWLAKLCIDEARKHGLQRIIVLGKAYKAGTNLTIGSYATLLVNILGEQAWVRDAGHVVEHWDPHTDESRTFSEQALFLVATNHEDFYTQAFAASLPNGSEVIDPWGRFADTEGLRVVRVGRR